MNPYFSEMFYVALFFAYFGLAQGWAKKKIPNPRRKRMLLELALILPVFVIIIKLVPDEYYQNSSVSAFLIGALLGMFLPDAFKNLWRLQK